MSKVTSTQNLALYDTCPIGAIIAFPAAAIPNGWLECNGQAVSRTAYAELFTLIGTTYGVGDGSATFNLPDYRGVFLRGKDNGKGYDAGRALGSFQDQDVQPHYHPLPYNTPSNASLLAMTSGSGCYVGGTYIVQTSNNAGTETRPKNVSVVYCIKATMAITASLSTVATFAALTHTTHNGEAASLATNGYKKFADGLILQWGLTGAAAASQSVTFPITFPTAVYSVVVTVNYAGATANAAASVTTSGFTEYHTGTTAVFWYAIGR